MKKLLLFFITAVLLLNLYQATAQVGIGTDMPNPSTQLEIISSNRGVMIPQVPLTSNTDQTTINAGNIESLLVYNINTNATLSPGYYYWYQGSWNRLLNENDLPDYIVFWDIVNNQFTYIDENGDVQVISIADLETLTFLGLNADGHTLEYTDEDGVVTSIDLETVIDNFETVTTIVDNGDGSFTYTDEDGNTTTIDVSNLETLTILALNPDGKTLEYTDEDGVVTSIDLETVIDNFETVTTIVDNGDGSFTYTDEDGNTTTIDVSNLETLTILALNPDGKTLEYTDEDGVVTSIDLETVIDNFETVTTIVDNGDGSFTYTDEDGNTTTIDVSNLETLTVLALNPDGKTLEYTDEDGVVTSIDLETVIDNFETVTTIVDNGDGSFTYTDEDGNTTTIDVSNLETLTVLALNPDGKTLEYTDEDGVVTSIDLETVIDNFETVTTIVDNGDGSFTYTDEDGNTTTIDVSNLETLTVLALNPDGKTLEYTDEDGVITSIDLETVIDNFETVTTIVDNGDGSFTYTDEDGNTTTIDVSNLETLTILALNPDGKTLEYTDEDGVVTSIDLETVIDNFETVTTIVDNGDGSFTYTDEDGNTTTIDVSNLETLTILALNPDGKTLEYTDEDGVVTSIDLETVIDNFETVTTIVDNGDGSFTYTDEDGNTTTIDVSNLETLTVLALNPDGKTLEYTDEDGVITSIDLETVIDNFETVTTIVDNGDGSFTYTDEDGNTTTIDVSNLETLTVLALNPDGKTLEYTDEDGVITSIDLETVIDNFETVTTIVDNGDGSFTYTDEDGNTTTIDVSNLETLTILALNPDGKTLEYTDEDGVVTSIDLETVIDNFETVTTIVDNGDGSFTYTDEDGNTTTIDVSNLETLTILALNPDGKTLEYTDEDGVVTSIDLETVIDNFETVTTIVDNGDGSFTYTDEDGNTTTIDVSNLETLTILALNPDGKTLEYTDEDGVVTSIDLETVIDNFETVTTIVDNGDGSFTYTDEDGNTTTIDVSSLETLTVLALNPDGKTLEYTDEDGVVTSIDLETVIDNFETVTTIVDNGDGSFTHTDEDGNTTTIDVSNLETLTILALNPDGKTLEYTDEDGVVTSIDLETVIDNFETVTTIVDNGDGSFTHTDEDGNTTTIDVSDLETLTVLALNPDGKTLEYTDEDGVVTSIDLETVIDNFETVTTMVDNGDGTFTYTDEDGNTTDVDILTLLTADNGLTKTNNNIQLGGNLITPTAITTDATNTLAIAGLQNGTYTDNLVVADPVSGVLKQTKSAMPKFFYMPSIVFDVSATGTNLTKNLHQLYFDQFTGASLIGSAGAPSAIPNIPNASDLYYYITYYDNTVFNNVNIDANGILTYDVISTTVNEASFMNIVFVVKE